MSGLIGRSDLTDFVAKFDGVLADGGVVSVFENCLADALAVDVGAIEAFDVFNDVVIGFRIDSGVVSGDGGVVDAKDVVGLTADGDGAAREQELLQDPVFKLEKQLSHGATPK